MDMNFCFQGGPGAYSQLDVSLKEKLQFKLNVGFMSMATGANQPNKSSH